MNKVLVEIMLPAADRIFDVYIPLDSKMGEVLQMVNMALSDLSEGKYQARKDAILCDAETGIIYNINLEVAELEIKNGSRLLLI